MALPRKQPECPSAGEGKQSVLPENSTQELEGTDRIPSVFQFLPVSLFCVLFMSYFEIQRFFDYQF